MIDAALHFELIEPFPQGVAALVQGEAVVMDRNRELLARCPSSAVHFEKCEAEDRGETDEGEEQ